MSEIRYGRSPKLHHPLHPAVVHFPIALFPLSSVFLVLWYLNGLSFYLHVAYWTFMIGSLLILPVALTGALDLRHVVIESQKGHQVLYFHIINGVIITFLSLINGIYFFFNKPFIETQLIPGFSVMALLITMLILVQGFLGGLLVYTHHLGVEGHTSS